MQNGPHNSNGGFTLVPLPKFERQAHRISKIIEEKVHKPTQDTPVDIALPKWGIRPSGEPFVQLSNNHISGHDVMVLAGGSGTPETLIQIMLILAYVKGRHARRISLVTGYFPLSRSDKDEGSLELALPGLLYRLFQTSCGNSIDRIIVPDPHSPQIVMAGETGIITPVSMMRRLLAQALGDAEAAGLEHICLLFPDDGAHKTFAKPVHTILSAMGMEHVPIFTAYKRRYNSHTTQHLGLVTDIESNKALLPNSLVITLDDELATGGTNISVAKALKEIHGVSAIWAAATHGVLCGNAIERFNSEDCPIDRVYITDTIPVHERGLNQLIEKDRLRVVSWIPDLANILFYHHWNMNIRAMR
ncbi:MAG: ribose-phosphate pyrophosphokinase [Candidatus Magasanikbacteria bacterium]|nr:ribose-phosphate pyrophosphokinase [Candidatus Magasanikbacteria bacterium]